MAGATSALLVPLVFRGTTNGVLAAFDRRAGGPEFTAEDERLMSGFAASAAAAVATAKSVAEDRLRLSIDASEQERKRWARELHDDTLQGLAGLGVMLGSALRAQSEDDASRGRDGCDRADPRGGRQAAGADRRAAARRTRRDRPESRGREPGGAHAVRRRGSRSRPRSRSPRTRAATRLAPEIESTAYRIVQEGLTNVGKHAAASKAEVRIAETNGRLDVAVRDDGRGFEPSAPRAGFGLTGMRERVEMLGGTLAVESSEAGLGTLVRASIPVRHVD